MRDDPGNKGRTTRKRGEMPEIRRRLRLGRRGGANALSRSRDKHWTRRAV
jgi:hypothetical protein